MKCSGNRGEGSQFKDSPRPPPSLHQTQSDAGSLRHVTFLIMSVLSDVQQIGL